MTFKLNNTVVASGCLLSLLSVTVVCAQEITGAGATFPAPIYSKWAAD